MIELLSSREMQVFERMAWGESKKEIANNLHVSYNTIDTHCSETLFRNWRNEGLLTFYKPGVILYKRADVDEFISNYEFKKF